MDEQARKEKNRIYQNAYMRDYYRKQVEKLRKYKRDWMRAYRENNRERDRQYQREYLHKKKALQSHREG